MTMQQLKTIHQLSMSRNLPKGDLIRALNALIEAAQLSDTNKSPKAKRLRRSADEVKSKLGVDAYNTLKGCLRSF